ncbi:SIR2 family protein [Pseudomonas sp. B28(2017)]|uniref:SIR2 family protein n=1 Tax=Pseudomonas sp. B28(2017) TaxID=1981730 RepID=UPI000A1FEC11|nr:SIR2 family protein [Pseudomonas sp. B28(2017)]
MRFFENGPDIPDSLISAREEGRVVFFCGAGVSIPAGFPSFLKLTLEVMKGLGVSNQSENPISAYKKMIEIACSKECPPDYTLPFSFDQVFYLLQQEYGLLAVEQEVSSALRLKKSTFIDNHKAILRLSKNSNQNPQVVTTNFDLLFEQAQRGVLTHVQPALPDLTSGVLPEGVIYLHGRLAGKSISDHKSRLIISSADFGRAYLADGWANRFIKHLAQQYVIVLLGYSAEDPPVRYLLEGMHSKSAGVGGSIYAFDRGTQERVDQNWRHKGVNGIAFNDFDDLWSSIGAWADYSEDSSSWRASVLKLAGKSPRDLSAFQRGQVTHLISSASGAELFYKAEPTPSAEWLCVFDPYVRNAKPEVVRAYVESSKYDYSPQDYYGLENDPLINYDSREPQYWGADFLSFLPGEGATQTKRGQGQGLVGNTTELISTRMRYLAAWLVKNLNEPWAIWWAAGKTGLNAHLLRMLENKLWEVADKLSDQVVRHWSILFDENNHKLRLDKDIEWYYLKDKLDKLGWNSLTLRYLEQAIRPSLTVNRRFRHTQPIVLGELVTTDVSLVLISFHSEEIEVSADFLPEVLIVWRNALLRMVQLAPELNYFPPVDLFRDDGDDLKEGADKFLEIYSRLFAKLVLVCPEKARREYDSWPENEALFFSSLKLFAMLCPGLFNSNEIFIDLLKSTSEEFWGFSYRHKVLELLVSNWGGFSKQQKCQIERRIIDGPPVKSEYTSEQSERYHLYSVGELLGGLEAQGCKLSKKSQQQLEVFRQSYEGSARIESGEFRKKIGKSGWVTTDKNASILMACPIDQITTIAQAEVERDFFSLVEQRPFAGLVEIAPLRALKSLVLDAKRGVYPIALWQQLLTGWPKSPAKLTMQAARRLILLPMDSIAQLSQAYSEWVLNHFLIMYDALPEFALLVWDKTIELFNVAGDETLKSSIVSIRRAGVELPYSVPIRESAQNSPLGRMTEALFSVYSRHKLKSGEGVPPELKVRLELLLSTKSQYLSHAVHQIAVRLDWLFWIEPEWVKRNILPLFQSGNDFAEAAWSGRLFDSRHFRPELFAEIKRSFISLFDNIQRWQWDRGISRILHQHLVLACRYGLKDDRFLKFDEVRGVLQITDDAGRAEALRYLALLMTSKSAWKTFGKGFLTKAWPRELRYLSHATTNGFLHLTEKAPHSFPDVVKLVFQFLTTVKRCDTLFYSSSKEPEVSSATQHPEAMLMLLDKILSEHTIPPYQLANILDQIVESKPSLAKDRRLLRLRKIAMDNI